MKKYFLNSIAALFVISNLQVLHTGCAGTFSNRDEWQKPGEVMDSIGVKPGMVIGEVGAGRGYFTLKLAERVGPGGNIYANDINRDALDWLRTEAKQKNLGNIEIIAGEIDKTLLPSAQLDLVLMVYTLHHLEKPQILLQDIKSKLKPGADFVILERDPDRFGKEYDHFFKEKKVVEIIQQAGYQVTRILKFLPRDNIYICRPAN